MEIQAQLAKGIKAATHGDRNIARNILYGILDEEPRNETAWVWLSYVVDSVEDRQVCLENVLTINPNNDYAQQGLSRPGEATVKQPVFLPPVDIIVKPTQRPLPLTLVIAFWSGVGILFFIFGIIDVISWGAEMSISRNFPRYITSYQLLSLAIAVTFFVIGVVTANLAWALYKGFRSGYFVSIILSLGLTLTGPIVLLILDEPNYILVIFMALMPAIILFLTLMSQAGFANDQQLAPNAGRDKR